MKYGKKGKLLVTGVAAALTASLATVYFGAPEAASTADAGNDKQLVPDAFAFGDERPGLLTAAATLAQHTPVQATSRDSLYRAASGAVTVGTDNATGNTRVVRVDRGGDLYPQGRSLPAAEKSTAFLERHGSVYGVSDPADQLRVIGMNTDQYGNARVSYQQMHGDIPVFGAVLHSHISKDGRLTAVNGKFVADLNLPQTPAINPDFAGETAISIVARNVPAKLKSSDLSVASNALVVYRTNLTKGTPGDNHLAYQLEVTHGGTVREFVYIDAITGKLVDQISGVNTLKHRVVHEGNIAAPPAWSEGDLRPAADPAHEDEISGAGYAYNLFYNLSGGTYRSWDGNDATMITVNNDPTIVCPNANWNGTSTNYCSATSADDVVVHEWAHAYTQETSGLIYSYQSGALNESYSDIFGETVDQINNRDTQGGNQFPLLTGNNEPRSQDESVCSTFSSEIPTSDQSVRWLMGEDAAAFTGLPSVGDAAIRDMWNPSCAAGNFFLGDPGHVSSARYHCDSSDAGGVHVNSAINNRAYALLVDGNTLDLKDDGTPFANPVTVQGIGLTKAAHIFWRANSVYNTPSSSFNDNADSLEMACADLIGEDLTKLVTDAENATGLLGSNDDTIDPTLEISGDVITANDCAQVVNAIAAVEMRNDVAQQCGFSAPLDLTPAPMCDGATVNTMYTENWETGSDGWTVGIERATNASTVDTLPWRLRSASENPTLPEGKGGTVMFQENRRDYGNCADDDESAVEFLESPDILVTAAGSQLVFEHYFITEATYDGGNVLINVNGETDLLGDKVWTIIPAGAFIHNPYNSTLQGIADQNTNPKAGEPSFDGSNPIDGTNVWGESQIDLEHPSLGVNNGDTIRLRWEFGQDGCNGVDGWYVNTVEVFSCGNDAPPPLCQTFEADVDDVNGQIISDLGAGVTGSTTTATVSGQGSIYDVNVINLKGVTNYSGDLDFTLTSPMGTTIRLDDDNNCDLAARPGFDVNFDDDAASLVSCEDWNHGGVYKPLDALETFTGEDGNGNWSLTVTDSFPDGVPDEVDGWALEFCPEPIPNTAPVAIADTDTTDQDTPTEIDVLGNDYDPDNGEPQSNEGLRIVSATQPANGFVTISDDMVFYAPNTSYCNTGGPADTFSYTIEDDSGDTETNSASAMVSVTVNCIDPGDVGDEVKGKGELKAIHLDNSDDDSSDDDSSDDDGDKDRIKFHFDPKRMKNSNELKGHLHLTDKNADVKIHMKEITYLGPVRANECGSITNGDGTYAMQFEGTGKFERGDLKIENATFRACTVDADPLDPKKDDGRTKKGGDNDRFSLACINDVRCSYTTNSRVMDDDVLDKGDVRIKIKKQ